MNIRMAFLAFALCGSSLVQGRTPSVIQAILAKHDPDRRLPNTTIEHRGSIKIGGATFDIYYLEFVNPESLHGQQRIAVVRNHKDFMGAYQCTLGSSRWDATLDFQPNQILVTMNDRPRDKQEPFVIQFTERGPSRNPYFCGEGSGWENSI
jgi:hypothetical protein